MGQACSTYGEMINAYIVFLVGKTKGKRSFERLRRRWEYIIKMDLMKVGKVWTGFIWLRIGTGGGLL
jgi:hypothetical protein